MNDPRFNGRDSFTLFLICRRVPLHIISTFPALLVSPDPRLPCLRQMWSRPKPLFKTVLPWITKSSSKKSIFPNSHFLDAAAMLRDRRRGALAHVVSQKHPDRPPSATSWSAWDMCNDRTQAQIMISPGLPHLLRAPSRTRSTSCNHEGESRVFSLRGFTVAWTWFL